VLCKRRAPISAGLANDSQHLIVIRMPGDAYNINDGRCPLRITFQPVRPDTFENRFELSENFDETLSRCDRHPLSEGTESRALGEERLMAACGTSLTNTGAETLYIEPGSPW
jgi:hypothetical protein